MLTPKDLAFWERAERLADLSEIKPGRSLISPFAEVVPRSYKIYEQGADGGMRVAFAKINDTGPPRYTPLHYLGRTPRREFHSWHVDRDLIRDRHKKWPLSALSDTDIARMEDLRYISNKHGVHYPYHPATFMEESPPMYGGGSFGKSEEIAKIAVEFKETTDALEKIKSHREIRRKHESLVPWEQWFHLNWSSDDLIDSLEGHCEILWERYCTILGSRVPMPDHGLLHGYPPMEPSPAILRGMRLPKPAPKGPACDHWSRRMVPLSKFTEPHEVISVADHRRRRKGYGHPIVVIDEVVLVMHRVTVLASDKGMFVPKNAVNILWISNPTHPARHR